MKAGTAVEGVAARIPGAPEVVLELVWLLRWILPEVQRISPNPQLSDQYYPYQIPVKLRLTSAKP
jgi:hypothetical protein